MGGDSFGKSDMNGADEATSGEIFDPVAGTVITIANKHATLRFRGEFVALSVINPELG
jgi:hypothetical protein